MPRKLETCPACRGYGYLHMLGRRRADKAQLVACDCRDGRRFLRVWGQEIDKLSPPAERESGPVHPETATDDNVAKEVQASEVKDGALRFHKGD